MRVILIRHGKTPGNETGCYIGRKTDEPLSEQGIENAKNCRIYDELVSDSNCHFYTSPMARARQTCELLFNETGSVIEELTEIDFGDFEGKNYQQLQGNVEYQAWIDSGGTIAFPNGENRQEFIERSMKGFWKVIHQTEVREALRCVETKESAKAPDTSDTAIVVCHGGNIMAILSSITGKEYFDFQVKNLEGYEIEFKTDNERIIDLSYNCIGFRNNS